MTAQVQVPHFFATGALASALAAAPETTKGKKKERMAVCYSTAAGHKQGEEQLKTKKDVTELRELLSVYVLTQFTHELPKESTRMTSLWVIPLLRCTFFLEQP